MALDWVQIVNLTPVWGTIGSILLAKCAAIQRYMRILHVLPSLDLPLPRCAPGTS
jgi:hypothetical protein